MKHLFINDTKVTISPVIEPDQIQVNHFYILYDSKNTLEYAVNLLEKNSSTGQIYLYAANEELAWKELSSLFEPVEAAGGIVKNPDGHILWIKRNGRWDLPKGKADHGETPEAAALREVSEETGLTTMNIIKPAGITYHSYIRKEKRLLKKTSWFEMKYYGNESFRPATDEGIEEVRWFRKNEMHYPIDDTFNSVKELIKGLGHILHHT